MPSKLFKKLKTGLSEMQAFELGKLDELNVRVSRRKLEVVPIRVKFTPKKIKALRIRLGLSQEQFARALGLQAVTVAKWEQGVNSPEAATLRLLEILEKRPGLLQELDILRFASTG